MVRGLRRKQKDDESMGRGVDDWSGVNDRGKAKRRKQIARREKKVSEEQEGRVGQGE